MKMQNLFGYEAMGSEAFEGNLEQRNSNDWNTLVVDLP